VKIPQTLHRKALPASAATAGVGVAEVKTFAIEAIGEIKSRIAQIQKTLQVGHYPYALVFKHLVAGLGLIIKIELVRQARTTTPDHTHAKKVIIAKLGFSPQLVNFFLRFITYVNHCILFFGSRSALSLQALIRYHLSSPEEHN